MKNNHEELIDKRLAELKAEFESGQKVMGELEAKQAKLRDTLLRISGAIELAEEMKRSMGQDQGDIEIEAEPQG